MFCFVLNAKPAALKRLVAYDYIYNNTFNFSWLATVITFNKSFFFWLAYNLVSVLDVYDGLTRRRKGPIHWRIDSHYKVPFFNGKIYRFAILQ